MIGIYKITNPNNKVYIGQSRNIRRRFSAYKRLECKKQVKLFNSLNKYGVINHKFEVIIELDKNDNLYLEKLPIHFSCSIFFFLQV